MTTFQRPMPVKTPTSAPFWDALAQHTIAIQYSPSTDAWVFYPRVRAPRTLANDLEWRVISGMGTLYSYTVARRPVAPHFADAVPQILAIVEWDEGPRFSTAGHLLFGPASKVHVHIAYAWPTTHLPSSCRETSPRHRIRLFGRPLKNNSARGRSISADSRNSVNPSPSMGAGATWRASCGQPQQASSRRDALI